MCFHDNYITDDPRFIVGFCVTGLFAVVGLFGWGNYVAAQEREDRLTEMGEQVALIADQRPKEFIVAIGEALNSVPHEECRELFKTALVSALGLNMYGEETDPVKLDVAQRVYQILENGNVENRDAILQSLLETMTITIPVLEAEAREFFSPGE